MPLCITALLWCFFSSLAWAEGVSSPISAEMKGPDNVSAKDYCVMATTLTNTSDEDQHIELSWNLPSEWQMISGTQNPIIAGHKTTTIFTTIYVPAQAKAEDINTITLSVHKPVSRELLQSYQKTLRVLPRISAHIAPQIAGQGIVQNGDTFKQSFRVTNTGNIGYDFVFQERSNLPWDIRIAPSHKKLEPQESIVVEAIVKVPLDFDQEVDHNLHLEIAPSSTQGVIRSAPVSMHILPIQEGSDLYEAGSLTTVMHGSTEGKSTDHITPQTEVYFQANPTTSSYLNTYYKGPYFKDRVNYRTIHEEKYRVQYTTPHTEWIWGEQQTELTPLSYIRQGQGTSGRWGAPEDRLRILAMMHDSNTSSGEDTTNKLLGTQLAYNITPRWTARTTHSQDKDDWAFSSNRPRPYTRQHHSLEQEFIYNENITFHNEIATSTTEDPTDHNNAQSLGHYSSVNYTKNKWQHQASFIDSGSEFYGPWQGTQRAHLFTRYFHSPSYTSYLALTERKSHTQDLAGTAATTSRSADFGQQFHTPFWGYFLANFVHEQDQLDNNQKEISQTWSLNWSRNIRRWLTLSLHDALTTRSSNNTNSAGISLSFNHGHCSLNLNHDRILTTTPHEPDSISTQNGVYLNYYFPRQKVTLSTSYINSEQDNTMRTTSDEQIFVSLSYAINNDNSLSFDIERRDNYADSGLSEWRSYVSWKRRFDVLIPWRPKGLTLTGRVFIDNNHNQIFDAGDTPIPHILVKAKNLKATSNARGEFKLRGLTLGLHLISLDPTSYNTQLSPMISLPMRIDIKGESLLTIDIPFTRTVPLIQGTVSKKPSELDWEHPEPYPYANLPIQLISSDGTFSKTTFTDERGYFLFQNIPWGTYTLSPQRSGLTPQEYIEDPQTITILADDHMAKDELHFSIAIKKRKMTVKKF